MVRVGTSSVRSTREVLDDHLALAAAGDWRTDLDRNVADDIVVLTGFEWTADGPTARVRDGADSFVIRDGRIVVQTIHYTVEVVAAED